MEEHGYKWQFTIQKNNGMSSGTIASEFGIKDYYTMPPPAILDADADLSGHSSPVYNLTSPTDTLKYWEQYEIPEEGKTSSLVTLRGSQLSRTRPESTEADRLNNTQAQSSLRKQPQAYRAGHFSTERIIPPPLSAATPELHRKLSDNNTRNIMKNQVTRKVKSLPDIPASALVSQNHIKRDTQSANDNYELLTLPKIEHHLPNLVSMSLNSYLTNRGKQCGNTIVVIQPEKQADNSDSSDDEYESRDYHYHYEAPKRRGSNTSSVKLPYILPALPPIKTRKMSINKQPLRIHVDLKYGKAVEDRKADMLPEAIQEELIREYGHIANTDVIIVRRNGNYTIHHRPQRRMTSEGLPLSNCIDSDISEDEESVVD